MTPCDCGHNHFGLSCSGIPLMLLDADDEPSCPNCPNCGDPRNESERVCAECRREGMQLARDVTMPALYELHWRRVSGLTYSPADSQGHGSRGVVGSQGRDAPTPGAGRQGSDERVTQTETPARPAGAIPGLVGCMRGGR